MTKAITTHKGVTLYEDGTAKITNDNEAMSAILDILAERFDITRQQAAELWKDMQEARRAG